MLCMMYRLQLLVLFLLISTLCFSQQNIRGTVISAEDNQPVIGAAISLKDKPSVGAATDLDGNFSLIVPEGSKTLVVSYLGMKTQEVGIKPVLKIVLQPDAEVLTEVVVTGMHRMDKRLFTGSTAKIDVADAKIDGMADISRSLEGRAAGVTVQNVSGTFGSAPKIRIRGASSIYGTSRPLWVVDGVIMEDNIEISGEDLSSGNAETLISSAIAGLNADDIESIQILKDGSATSIYGARAMAGVVVVTTKKGRVGETRLSYVGEFTTRLKPSYKNYNISNSQEQMGIYREMKERGWLEAPTMASAANNGVYGKMYDLINTWKGNGYGLDQLDAAENQYLRQSEFVNTDWFDSLFNSNVVQSHAVSITSGTEKSQFYFSLSALNDPGWTKASSVERYTINAKASFQISPSVKINLLGNGSRRDQTAPGTISQEQDPVSGEVNRGFDINPYSYALNSSRALLPNEYYRRNYADFNIFHELKNNYIDMGQTDLKFQADMEWKVLKGWNINALGAIRYSTTAYEHHIKDHSNQAMAYRAGVVTDDGPENAAIREVNPYLYTDPDIAGSLPETILPVGGIYNRTTYDLKSLDFRLSTTYVTEFDEKHLINIFGGMELNSTDRNNSRFRGWGYQYDNGGDPFSDYSGFKQAQEEKTYYYARGFNIYRNLAFFGTATYSYEGRYVLNGTARYEGSNKLGKSRTSRWLPTWNIAGAWNSHEEKWFKNDVLTRGTLKASYSLTADRGPAWVSNSTPMFKADIPWRPTSSVLEPGAPLDKAGNNDLTYEKKRELSIGVDLGFVNERIGLAVDYYTRRNYDLIGLVYTGGIGLPGITAWANSASMKSSGWEIGISSVNMRLKDFEWRSNFNFAKTKNEITKLASTPRVLSLVTGGIGASYEGSASRRQGYPVGALFSIPFAGLDDEGLPMFINEHGEVTTSDLNFQENKKLDFLHYDGTLDPTITGSLDNTFVYKNFQLGVFITYSFGNVVRLDPLFSSSYSDMDAMPKEFKNRWMISGDEAHATIPAIANLREGKTVENVKAAYNAYNYSTARIAKGDFIRLKDISLAYEVPRTAIQSLKLTGLSFKLLATNLFLLHADKKLNGQDPEFFNSGGVAVPLPKQFTLTVRLSL